MLNAKAAHAKLENRLSSIETRAKNFLPTIEKDIIKAINNDCNLCISIINNPVITEKVAEQMEQELKSLGYGVYLCE